MTAIAHIRRLNGITAPVGTLLGPNAMGEYFTVREVDDRGVICGYATSHDVRAAETAAHTDGPRSMTEVAMLRRSGA